MINGGIFGPKLSGKSTLAQSLSREYWLKHKRRSLVLDPHMDVWGDQAWVTAEEEKFWPAVWNTQNSLVIVEESAATIRRERSLVPVFTRLRHNHHYLLIIGHNGTDLLPVMRQQLDVLYLFRQPKEAAEIWSKTFCDERLLEAQQLKQYEFIRLEMYKDPVKMILPKPKNVSPV